MTTEIDRDHPVRDILGGLRQLADSDEVYVRDMMVEFGETSFLPVLLVPALLVMSPLSGIPLLSTICGLTIAIICAQRLFGRSHLWLPDVFMRRSVPGPRLRNATDKMRRVATWIDRLTRPRLRWLFAGPLFRVPMIACMLCGLAMPFLEFVPFTSSMLGTAVVCLAVGLLARDGLFVLAGYGVILGASLVLRFVASQVAAVV